MIKGRYEATLTVSFSYTGNEPGLLSFEDIVKNTKDGELERAIVATLSEELGDEFSIGLKPTFAEVKQE